MGPNSSFFDVTLWWKCAVSCTSMQGFSSCSATVCTTPYIIQVPSSWYREYPGTGAQTLHLQNTTSTAYVFRILEYYILFGPLLQEYHPSLLPLSRQQLTPHSTAATTNNFTNPSCVFASSVFV